MAAADGKARRAIARVRQEAAAMLQKSRRELQIPSRPVTEEEQKNVHESSEVGTSDFERSDSVDCVGGDLFWGFVSVPY